MPFADQVAVLPDIMSAWSLRHGVSPAPRRWQIGLAVLVAGCTSKSAATSPAAPPPAQPASIWTLDRSTFDTSVAPCDDFYQYVCGGWAKRPIPADRTELSWSREPALARVARLIDQLLTGTEPAPHPEVQRLRTFYAACA